LIALFFQKRFCAKDTKAKIKILLISLFTAPSKNISLKIWCKQFIKKGCQNFPATYILNGSSIRKQI
jgi:hypothetical protein